MEQTANVYPSFYTVEDIQKMLRIGRNSAYKLVQSKGFPRINVGNRVIIPADLFENWITSSIQGGGKNGR